MPLTNRRNRVFRAILWTAISAALGVAILFIIVGALWPDPDLDPNETAVWSGELSVHVYFGIVALLCLPVVLYLDGRTIPRSALRPKVLAGEKLREFLTDSGRGGEAFLDRDGSVETLQRHTGGWVPITLGLIGIFLGTIASLGAVAAMVLAVTLCSRRSWALCISALVVAMIAQFVAYLLTPESAGSFELPVFLSSTVLFSILVVIGVIRGAREQGLIDTAAQTLLRGQARQDRAIAEVRRGIARDMHDSLSHHLSVIAMYAGALSVREDLDPDSVRESARLIAGSARRSGVELREVLTMLRGDDQGTVVDPDLDRLVRTRSDTVTLDYQPPLSAAALQDLGALERTTIYRFVQEAITNAVKHAPGERLRITVAADENPETLVLTASNPRRAAAAEAGAAKPSSPVTGSGLGLLGLRERMEAMGGTLTVSRGDDFVLRATLPATGLATPAEVEPSAQPAVGPSGTPTHTQTPEDAPTEPTGEERP
ncbi:sensor histidine kinase [Brevibacterium casei]|uniref:histidine kinase n=2 Tax=Brevibacterium casei TaxID=33889 RepID=A0A269ZGI6_9MICO|nr:histidine kinase [Brevibacterium casei]PAK96917.1 two-component sensor histidine kinase [Brevibacterium casei]QPR38560.1 two-component sensor histidine kinase [Brevibacterium casei]QPR42726.1 two-component sensor histidine kinase [Brevibacterium casei]SMX64612.1 Signal transduction histidine kinase [Brevibacterium casei CIP 102111]VEW13387.1 Nitrate/nitrite sensor protein narX [Brevibacterium casei]